MEDNGYWILMVFFCIVGIFIIWIIDDAWHKTTLKKIERNARRRAMRREEKYSRKTE